ncbi:hypothetical protein BOX15_Mlig034374g2, partial [Macrostomum lignano]
QIKSRLSSIMQTMSALNGFAFKSFSVLCHRYKLLPWSNLSIAHLCQSFKSASNTGTGIAMKPTEWQKRILVLAKKYPNTESVPASIDYESVYKPAWLHARRKFRIYLFVLVVGIGHVIVIAQFLRHRGNYWKEVQARSEQDF